MRVFNEMTRQSGGGERTVGIDVETVVRIASAKLRAVYEIVRGHSGLSVSQDDLVCTVGALCQIPWELNADKDMRVAHVCLDPTSVGLAAVEIPDIRLGERSRVGLIGDTSDLHAARSEINTIVSLFGSRTESFPRADLTSFQEAARRCQVLHIAAHGTQSWQDPRDNAVVFAHDTVKACDLARLDLGHVDLIVINACDAAAPGPFALAGEASIAGALMAAGAKAVIAALWSVEGSCAAVFASALYVWLAAGLPLLRAFQEARAELRSYATTLVGDDCDFLTDAYRMVIRGRGIADPPAPGPVVR